MENCKMHNLDEASLSRVLQHVQQQKNTKSWGIMTAYRSLNTPKQNRELNKSLESDLRSKGLGFFKVEGRWRECTDSNLNYAECPQDKLKDSIEESFFVPNIGIKDAHKLGNKYNQDSVLYAGEQTKGNAFLIYRDGHTENVGKIHADTIQQAYSKMKSGTKLPFSFKRGVGQKEKQPDVAKLISKLPNDIANKTVRNPITGKNIKVTSALKYDDKSPVKKAATSLVAMMAKR
jgi:hypothetical protein